MKKGFYYIVSGSGFIVWVYTSCGLALMDLTAMWANGSHGLMIVYNDEVLYRLGDNGIEKIGA
jgi:hypothetical protein